MLVGRCGCVISVICECPIGTTGNRCECTSPCTQHYTIITIVLFFFVCSCSLCNIAIATVYLEGSTPRIQSMSTMSDTSPVLSVDGTMSVEGLQLEGTPISMVSLI
jgi:hypothetical protein